MHRSKEQASNCNEQPDHADLVHCLFDRVRRGHQPKKRWTDQQEKRREQPDANQYYFAIQVVAHLDGFFVFIRGLINLVVALWFKEEVPGLSCAHRPHPADNGGHRRI